MEAKWKSGHWAEKGRSASLCLIRLASQEGARPVDLGDGPYAQGRKAICSGRFDEWVTAWSSPDLPGVQPLSLDLCRRVAVTFLLRKKYAES